MGLQIIINFLIASLKFKVRNRKDFWCMKEEICNSTLHVQFQNGNSTSSISHATMYTTLFERMLIYVYLFQLGYENDENIDIHHVMIIKDRLTSKP